MREFINANETIREDDERTIAAAIELAHEDGCNKVVIPRYNARTKTTKWSLPRAVQIPSHTTIILDNCYMEQARGSYENLFTSWRSMDVEWCTKPENEVEDIALIGEGNVTLSGGEHNHCLEKTNRNYGLPGMWVQPILMWVNVNGLRMENLHLEHQRWWSINHIMCRNVKIKNINFYAIPHVPNLDGIDLRIGCNNFEIENITGRTGDDVVAFTALKGRGEVPRMVPGKDTHIRDIKVRNIKGDANNCYPLRLLNHDDNEIYNIEVDTIMDSSDPDSRVRGGAGLSIGSPFYFSQHPAAMGDTHDIHVKNIYTRCTFGVIMNHVLNDTTISNVHTFKDNIDGIVSMVDGVALDKVVIDGLYCGSDQPLRDDGSPIARENYIGSGIRFPKLNGKLTVKHMELGPIGKAVSVQGGGTVEIEDLKETDTFQSFERDDESKIIVNGEEK